MTIDNAAKEFLESIAEIKPTAQEEDTVKDGILYCGKCGEPKQAWINWIPDEDGNCDQRLVRVMCRCDMEAEQREKEQKVIDGFAESMRSIDLALHTDRNAVRWNFSDDDSAASPISRTCRKYIDQWREMKKDNIGILFYGSKGNGQSFYASCIYNELKRRMETVGFISTANLMNILGTWDKTEIFDAIRRVHLLVLDDLGAERDTSYSAELMYNVIDTRYKAALPTIVTTNIDLYDMENENDIWRSRIYDRVIEMCPITLKMEGNSRRSGIANARKERARELMRSAGRGN